MNETPLVADAKAMAKILAVGLRTIRAWDCGGILPEPCRIGGRVLWRLEEVREWLNAGSPDRKAWAAIKAVKKR